MSKVKKRKLDDILTAWLEYTKNTESPTPYHLWSCISTIASTMERRVYMDWGHTKIYPNMYVSLIGPSGGRKGEPISIARDFLNHVRVNIVSQSIIREALIRRMKQVATTYPAADRTLESQSAMAVVSAELAVFLGENNIKLLADLTDWYDSQPKWVYETKGSGTDEIIGVCFNMLGAMAPDWIPLVLPHGAIGGGFTSRIIFVVEHKKGKTITNPNLHGVDRELGAAIKHDLELIKMLAGPIRFEPEALKLYEDWYAEEDRKIELGMPSIKDPRFAGYVSRRATHIKKLAMTISVARSSSLRITENDFLRAKGLLETVEVNMSDVFGKVGRTIYTAQTQEVMDIIRGRGEIKRSELMRIMYRDIDDSMMRGIEATLTAMKVITSTPLTDGRLDYMFKWIGN